MDIPEFIKRTDEYGETYLVTNPEYQKAIDKKKFEYKMKQAGIPEFYFSIDFDDYKGERSKKELDIIKDFCKDLNHQDYKFSHIYLVGSNNTQKTAVACNILKEGIKQRLNVRFVLAGTLLDKLMKVQGFNRDKEIEKYLEDLEKCDLICVDDVFDPDKSLLWRNSDNNSMIVSLWDVFIRKMVSSKTTLIFTSNFNISQIKLSYSESLYELVDRNFQVFILKDDIKAERKKSNGFSLELKAEQERLKKENTKSSRKDRRRRRKK